MAGLAQASGKYSVLVLGGNANVGHRAKMNFYRGQRRGLSTLSTRTTTTATRITESGQVLQDIPVSVLSEVFMYLNNPSPLGNNWKAVAAELSLSYQAVQSLDHHGPGGMMEGVLKIMSQRKMTVRDLANILEKIQRPDVVEILVKAGLPENDIWEDKTNGDGNVNGSCSNNNVQDGSKLSRDITSQTNSTKHTVDGCKQTYNHKHSTQTRSGQEAMQNKQTTKEQEAKQNMQTARDSPNTQSGAEFRKIPNASKRYVPCADKSTDLQRQASNGIIFQEFAGRSQHELLNYGIPIQRSAGESPEDVADTNIIEKTVAFIVTAFSGSCGRLGFRNS